MCFLRPRPQKTIELHDGEFVVPSWTLNFAEHITKSFNLFTTFPDGSLWRSFSRIACHPFLETSGVFFDKIVRSHHTDRDWESEMGTSAQVRRWRFLHGRWRSFFGQKLNQSDHSCYIDGGSVEEVHWRTITGDMCGIAPGAADRLQSSTINAFVRWVRSSDSHELHPDQPDWEVNQVVDTYAAATNTMAFGRHAYLLVTQR